MRIQWHPNYSAMGLPLDEEPREGNHVCLNGIFALPWVKCWAKGGIFPQDKGVLRPTNLRRGSGRQYNCAWSG